MEAYHEEWKKACMIIRFDHLQDIMGVKRNLKERKTDYLDRVAKIKSTPPSKEHKKG